MAENEILMEVQRYGTILRVTAIDAATCIEVVFQAPSSTSQMALQKLAASKLRYVMSKGGIRG